MRRFDTDQVEQLVQRTNLLLLRSRQCLDTSARYLESATYLRAFLSSLLKRLTRGGNDPSADRRDEIRGVGQQMDGRSRDIAGRSRDDGGNPTNAGGKLPSLAPSPR
jgi:hypothetical protein